VYKSKGEYDKALAYYQKSLNIKEKVYGENHPSTATSYNNIAILYYTIEDFKNAYKYMKWAVEVWSVVLPASHPDLKDSIEGLEVIKSKLEL
jgi:tetratricopeptide (TPR) repeat protein